jgi:hypothetical protein
MNRPRNRGSWFYGLSTVNMAALLSLILYSRQIFAMIITTLNLSGYSRYRRVKIKEFYILPTQCI